jgi:cation diffusion facilitator CzcD-associated flavoprotein CzcO
MTAAGIAPRAPQDATADTIAEGWLTRYAAAVAAGDAAAVGTCFLADGYWKDILAFSWTYRTFSGRDAIEAAFAEFAPATAPENLRIADGRMAPRIVKRSAKLVVEAYVDFDTAAGGGTAFVRLLVDGTPRPDATQAWLMLTTLQHLHGAADQVGDARPTGVQYSQNFAGDNWADERDRERSFADRDPQVLIVGGGQCGLVLATRLRQMGVDALVVERNERVGDNWRKRYHSLTLHNEVWANSLPYMPFPPTWPTFLPKDKLAGWLEAYAEAMEVNVWTSTEFVSGDYDEAAGMWTARVRRTGGPERTIRAPHLVMATGSVSGIPRVPDLPGLDMFAGEVIHSAQFTSGIPYAGKRAIVIGTGNSGHDVAQDLHANGAAVTIVQRSPTSVVSLVPSGTMVYALYSEGPVEDIDLITAAIPYPVLRETYQWLTRKTCELDAELLERLHAVGFETSFEPDGTGFHMRYLRTGGGYYINVGCSDLIASRAIGLVQARDIATFDAGGIRLQDGTLVGADLIVLATGYENQQEGVRRLLGSDVADKLGPIWGFDEDHFMRNMWRPTAQEGFWIMGGALNEARLYSRFLAVQLKAALDGVLPEQPGRPVPATAG